MQIHQQETGMENFNLSILGDTKVVACMEKSTDGSLRITAPPRVFKMAPLETMAGQNVSALATEFGISRDLFSIETGFVIDVHRQCQAIVVVKYPQALDLLRSQAVVSRCLNLIKHRDTDSESLLPLDGANLRDDTTVEMNAAASAMLAGCGGTPITTPATFFLGATPVCQFRGMFAPRPDLSDLNPEAIEFLGRFDGFRLKKRCIFIDTDEQQIQVNWELDEQLDSIMELAKNPKSLLRISVEKTVDQRGQPVYSLDKWAYDQSPTSTFKARRP